MSENYDLAADNVRLHRLLVDLTPWALAGLRAERFAPGSAEAQLLNRLEAETTQPIQPSSLPCRLISDLSEELWCAGWLTNCEFELWARIQQYRRTGHCSAWGFSTGEDIDKEIALLDEAVRTTGSWARWADKACEPVLVENWLAMHWPEAPQYCRDLAESYPDCGEFGPLVKAKEGGWPHLVACRLPRGHEGEHEFNLEGVEVYGES